MTRAFASREIVIETRARYARAKRLRDQADAVLIDAEVEATKLREQADEIWSGLRSEAARLGVSYNTVWRWIRHFSRSVDGADRRKLARANANGHHSR